MMLKRMICVLLLTGALVWIAGCCECESGKGIYAQPETEMVWITNSNGSQTPVRLRKEGPNYIGPNGEVYKVKPTEEQLKQLYGM